MIDDNDFSEYKTRVINAILEILRWFAGHQIRNVAVSILNTEHSQVNYDYLLIFKENNMGLERFAL